MASEEERAAILAEYKAAASAGFSGSDDDEADFDPGDDSDEDSASEEEEPDYVILDGSLSLNEEGRLIYSGVWCMKSDGTKHHKFKMRSQEVFHSKEQLVGGSDEKTEKQDDGPKKAEPSLFDLYRPTLSKLDKSNGSDSLPMRRTIIFDGFFIEKSNENKDGAANGDHKKHSEKIKERDVEIFIQHNSEDAATISSYDVTGRGCNSYGPFVLEGKYTVPNANELPAVMELHKIYGSGGNAKDSNVARGSKRRNYESDDDEDEVYEEKAGFAELIELTEDANLSVEELRRKYYGGDGEDEKEDGDGGGGKLPAKKARLEESDDSDCGF
jgi:hypothetical protein